MPTPSLSRSSTLGSTDSWDAELKAIDAMNDEEDTVVITLRPSILIMSPEAKTSKRPRSSRPSSAYQLRIDIDREQMLHCSQDPLFAQTVLSLVARLKKDVSTIEQLRLQQLSAPGSLSRLAFPAEARGFSNALVALMNKYGMTDEGLTFELAAPTLAKLSTTHTEETRASLDKIIKSAERDWNDLAAITRYWTVLHRADETAEGVQEGPSTDGGFIANTRSPTEQGVTRGELEGAVVRTPATMQSSLREDYNDSLYVEASCGGSGDRSASS